MRPCRDRDLQARHPDLCQRDVADNLHGRRDARRRAIARRHSITTATACPTTKKRRPAPVPPTPRARVPATTPGICKSGTRTCILSADKTSTTWGTTCVGQVLPAAADTCVSGNDDTCNGIPNQGCTCINGATDTCGNKLAAKGTCAGGTTTCAAGQWGACSIQPKTADTCVSGNDDNCNGTPNNGCTCINGATDTCGNKLAAKGTCASGTTTCAAGQWGACSIQPKTADTCDLGNDDTCDGAPNTGCICDGFTATGDRPNPTDYDTSVAGMVVDKATGRTWERAANTAMFTQGNAFAYCVANRLGGFTNWRLPTVTELLSIVDITVANPAINSTVFPSTPSTYFWTSTSVAGDGSQAWTVRFTFGEVNMYLIDLQFPSVRCVR